MNLYWGIRVLLSPLYEMLRVITKVIVFWPSTPFGSWLRMNYYKLYLNSLGKNVILESGVRFGDPSSIDIGDNCVFARNVNISSGNCFGVYIGNFVAIADGTYLRSGNHSFDNIDTPIQNQGHWAKSLVYNDRKYSVIIEDDVWIGARVIILSGAKIGKGSVISAGSVISNEIPPYSIVVGNPGRVISNRKIKKNEI